MAHTTSPLTSSTTFTFTQVSDLHPHNSGLELCHIVDDVVGDRDIITADEFARISARLVALL